MTTLYLLRHGQTDWNLQGRWQGHADIPLNPIGLQQAERLASDLAPLGIQAIYSSDLQRARQTAQVLARVVGLPVMVDSRLREIDQGEWQGLAMDEIRRRYSIAYHKSQTPVDFAPPGGESLAQLQERLVAALEEISDGHPGQRVAVVSHGFAVAVLLAHYRGLSLLHAWEMIPTNEEWHTLLLNDRHG